MRFPRIDSKKGRNKIELPDSIVELLEQLLYKTRFDNRENCAQVLKLLENFEENENIVELVKDKMRLEGHELDEDMYKLLVRLYAGNPDKCLETFQEMETANAKLTLDVFMVL